jgi:tetratricopeptide (TPR) repeat protein
MADMDDLLKTNADFYIEKLKGMVKSAPDSRLFLTLAEELKKRDEHEEAMTVLSAGIRNNPTFVAARLTLGRWYLKEGLFPEARKEFTHVLELAPDDKFAARYIREADSKIGDVKGAKVVQRLNKLLDGVKKAFEDDSLKKAVISDR